jgi:MFS superfamily sulfate permease-like transporter
MSFQNLFRDQDINLKPAIVVALIAIPLSLGIALASGAPPTSGLISAILGGLVGGYLGGSQLAINGPAAGLIVVVLTAIQVLGQGDSLMGFKRMLACIVIVGILQIVSGVMKLGKFVLLFPVSVVYGMLTSIGFIIMIKQVHVFLGHSSKGNIIESVMQIPESFMSLSPEASLIGLISMLILLAYPYVKFKASKVIPAPLVVVIVSLIMAKFLPTKLVSVPLSITDYLIGPQFDILTSAQSLKIIITIYFVASLESLLSASAVDKLDPHKRATDFNRELIGKGFVNLACGFLGGLPVIAEIVRSSASVSQGATNKSANFLHGLAVLIAVFVLPKWINQIPLSALAAILVLVGYRLAHPQQFKRALERGLSSFAAFLTTIIFTLGVDLLVGLFLGVVVKAMVSYFQGASIYSFFNPSYKIYNQGEKAILEFEDSLVFFSALKQKQIFDQVSQFKNVEVDLRKVRFLDSTSIELMHQEARKLKNAGRDIVIDIPEKYQALFKNASNDHS